MAKHVTDYSTTAVRVFAGGAVLLAGLCTTTMNWQFGHQLASSEFDGRVLGTFSVALDICKWFALGLAALAWRSRAYLRVTAGFAVWLVAVAYSSAAAIGFSALNRDTVAVVRNGETERVERARNEFKEATAAIETAKANERWLATSACTNATAVKSLEFCDSIKRLEERASAAGSVLDHGHAKEADPQTSLIARMTGQDAGRVKTALAIAVAVVAEVVSAFGLFAVMPPPEKQSAPARVKAKKRRKPAPKPEPSAQIIPFDCAANEN